MRPRILLLSGTSEGPVLGRALLDAGLDVVATVTREGAVRDLFGPLNGELTVEVRGFDAPGLRDYLVSGVDAVLDATHPFAVRITRIARDVCAELRRSVCPLRAARLASPRGDSSGGNVRRGGRGRADAGQSGHVDHRGQSAQTLRTPPRPPHAVRPHPAGG